MSKKYKVLAAIMLIAVLVCSCGQRMRGIDEEDGETEQTNSNEGPFAIVMGDIPYIDDDPLKPSVVSAKSSGIYKQKVTLTVYVPQDKILSDFKVNNSIVIGNKIEKWERKDDCSVYEYSFTMPRGSAVISGRWYDRNIEGVGLIKGSTSNLLTSLSVEGAPPIDLADNVFDYNVTVPFRYVPVNITASGAMSDTGIRWMSTEVSSYGDIRPAGYGEVSFVETITVTPALMMLFSYNEWQPLYPNMTTQTYKLHITREAASKNNALSSLVLEEADFEFMPEVDTYNVTVPGYSQGLNVSAVSADELSKVQVQLQLQAGEETYYSPVLDLAKNEISSSSSYTLSDPATAKLLVRVTSEAATTKIYTLNINRDYAEAPPNAPPVISPKIGHYDASQTFAIETLPSSPTGTVIRYTLDNTVPNQNSPRYTRPFEHTVPLTIKAIAIFPGGEQSVVVTSAYTAPVCLAPVITLPAGAHPSTINVDVFSEWGSTIYYTLDGSEPTLDSAHVSTSSSNRRIPGAIPATVKAFAVAPNRTASRVVSVSYTQSQQSDVTLSNIVKVAPNLSTTNVVTFSSPEADGFYYTVNGTVPSVSSGIYASGSSVTLKGNAGLNTGTTDHTLKVIAVKNGYIPSAVATETGFKQETCANPVWSTTNPKYLPYTAGATSTNGTVYYSISNNGPWTSALGTSELTLYAKAAKSGAIDSSIVSKTYPRPAVPCSISNASVECFFGTPMSISFNVTGAPPNATLSFDLSDSSGRSAYTFGRTDGDGKLTMTRQFSNVNPGTVTAKVTCDGYNNATITFEAAKTGF